jgi:ubiquinone/menaquinone biosynthesis C-methylase UbiE
MTPEMVERAERNLQQAGVRNAQVVLACAEAMPYIAHRFDVVLSNGVLNLSPLKTRSFREIVRVLKPGGRLQYADIVLQETLPAEVAGNLEAWSG